MLKQRIITAVILAPIVVAGLFLLPPMGFALFTAAVLAIGGWEWANLAGVSRQAGRIGYALALMLAMVLFYQVPVLPMLMVVGVFWLGAFFLVHAYPERVSLWAPMGLQLAMGLVVLVGAWLALNHLRSGELSLAGQGNNLLLILYTFLVVWAADIGAYFSGKAFGRRKLAPSVSPGKSWAGVYGGLGVVFLLATAVMVWLEPTPAQWVLFTLFSLATAFVSVLGDLLVSMLKRHRGIKDTSQLLPGHGGIMDRIDSLVAAIPVLALCFTLAGWLLPAA